MGTPPPSTVSRSVPQQPVVAGFREVKESCGVLNVKFLGLGVLGGRRRASWGWGEGVRDSRKADWFWAQAEKQSLEGLREDPSI